MALTSHQIIEKIHELRLSKNLSRHKLLYNAGISPDIGTSFKLGKISLTTLLKIIEYYQLPLCEFVGMAHLCPSIKSNEFLTLFNKLNNLNQKIIVEIMNKYLIKEMTK
jgi:hypothetical protein